MPIHLQWGKHPLLETRIRYSEVPDIQAAVNFLTNALGVKGFAEPEHIRAQDLSLSYYGQLVAGEWLTTKTYNGASFIELIQPLSGQSMFHDYLAQHPAGGTQHLAFRLPIESYEQVTRDLVQQGYDLISEVDHAIARMGFLTHIKCSVLPPRLWALSRKARRPSNKCAGVSEVYSSYKSLF